MDPFVQLDGRLLVIFDGQCGLCNRAVRWLLARDRGDRLRFAASQDERIAGLLARQRPGLADAAGGPGTILVVSDTGEPAERVLSRSDAVVALLRELPLPWPMVGSVMGWVPRPVRDLGYRIVARWRYRIWGRLEVCPIPTAAERERFL